MSRLTEFCQEKALFIPNILFQPHKRRLYTWTSPDGQYQNQIDYILCSQRWRSSISSVQSLTSVRLFATHGLQHARPTCPLPAPGVHADSCPLSLWCHSAISYSVIPFSSCPQAFWASGSFQVSQLFASGGQSIGVSALASFLPKKSQGWSLLGWTG